MQGSLYFKDTKFICASFDTQSFSLLLFWRRYVPKNFKLWTPSGRFTHWDLNIKAHWLNFLPFYWFNSTCNKTYHASLPSLLKTDRLFEFINSIMNRINLIFFCYKILYRSFHLISSKISKRGTKIKGFRN